MNFLIQIELTVNRDACMNSSESPFNKKIA